MKSPSSTGPNSARPTTQPASTKSAKDNAGTFDGRKVSKAESAKINPAPQQAKSSSKSHQPQAVAKGQVETLTPRTAAPQADAPRTSPGVILPESQFDPFQNRRNPAAVKWVLSEVVSRNAMPQGVQSNTEPQAAQGLKTFRDLQASLREEHGGTLASLKDFVRAGSQAALTGDVEAGIAARAVLDYITNSSVRDPAAWIGLDLDKLVENYKQPFLSQRRTLFEAGLTLGELMEFQKSCKVFGLKWEAEALQMMFDGLSNSGDRNARVPQQTIQGWIQNFITLSTASAGAAGGEAAEKYGLLTAHSFTAVEDLSLCQRLWQQEDMVRFATMTDYMSLRNAVGKDLATVSDEQRDKLRSAAYRAATLCRSQPAIASIMRIEQFEIAKAKAAEEKRQQAEEKNRIRQKESSDAQKAAKELETEQKKAGLTIQSAQDEKQLEDKNLEGKHLEDEKAAELETPKPNTAKDELNPVSERPRWHLPEGGPPKVTKVFQPNSPGGFKLTENSKKHILETHRAGAKQSDVKSQFPSLKNRQILRGIQAVANSSDGQWKTSFNNEDMIVKIGKMDLEGRSYNDWDGTIAIVAVAKTQEIVTAYPLNLKEANAGEQ